MCICVYTRVHMHMHVCAHVETQEQTRLLFIRCHPPCLLGQDPSLRPRAQHLVWTEPWYSLSLGLQVNDTLPGSFLLSFWESNAGPQICTMGT